MRVLGIGVLVSAVLSVATSLLMAAPFQAMLDSTPGTDWQVVMLVAMVVSLVMAIAVHLAASWWVSHAYLLWCLRDRRALGHALGIGLVLVILGGLRVLGMGMSGVLGGFGMRGMSNPGLPWVVSEILGLAIGVGMIVLGTLILAARGKPMVQAAFGVAYPPQYPPPYYPPQG